MYCFPREGLVGRVTQLRTGWQLQASGPICGSNERSNLLYVSLTHPEKIGTIGIIISFPHLNLCTSPRMARCTARRVWGLARGDIPKEGSIVEFHNELRKTPSGSQVASPELRMSRDRLRPFLPRRMEPQHAGIIPIQCHERRAKRRCVSRTADPGAAGFCPGWEYVHASCALLQQLTLAITIGCLSTDLVKAAFRF